MSIHEVSTATCDRCGKSRTSVSERFSSRLPMMWGELNTQHLDADTEKMVYDEWHLCDECTGIIAREIVGYRSRIAVQG